MSASGVFNIIEARVAKSAVVHSLTPLSTDYCQRTCLAATALDSAHTSVSTKQKYNTTHHLSQNRIRNCVLTSGFLLNKAGSPSPLWCLLLGSPCWLHALLLFCLGIWLLSVSPCSWCRSVRMLDRIWDPACNHTSCSQILHLSVWPVTVQGDLFWWWIPIRRGLRS